MSIITELSHIVPSINRIQASLPINLLYQLIRYVEQVALFKCRYPTGNNGKYDRREYWLKDCLLRIQYQQDTINRPPHARIYLTVVDPSIRDQLVLKELLMLVGQYTYHGQYGALVDQFEVTYDLFGPTDDSLSYLWNYLLYHTMPKPRKLRKIKSNVIVKTWYIGNSGNIRRGQYGLRGYVKTRVEQRFCRYELQFNKPFVAKNDITVLNLPIEPYQFSLMDYVDYYDNFSDKGVKKIVTKILKNRGICESSSNDFNEQYFPFFEEIKKRILTDERGLAKPVVEQRDSVNKIKKEYNLTLKPAHYFETLNETTLLMKYHSAAGFCEPGATERIFFVQS